MLRHARKEISWRANRIPHPFCLGLELLDYGLLRWDVFLGLKVLGDDENSQARADSRRHHSRTETLRGLAKGSITRVKLSPP
jgi:hypothetical protein